MNLEVKMKVFLAVTLLAVFSGLCFAQDDAIEKDFNKNKKTFKVERASMGEDASSGFDYVIYKNGSKIVKLRVIWSSSAGPVPTIDDYYFADGKLVLSMRSTLQKKFLKSAVKGNVVPLKTEEKLWLKDDKLTVWIEKGKTIDKTDKRWTEREKEALEAAKNELESFKDAKEN
jgi:hypothetical protein